MYTPKRCDARTAEEVVRCLERAIGAQQDLHEALKGCSGGDGSGLAAWRVLLRQLRAAAAAATSREAGIDASSRAETAPEAGREAGGGGGGGGGAHVGRLGVHARESEMSNAARVLLGELEPLETLEVRVLSRIFRWAQVMFWLLNSELPISLHGRVNPVCCS